MKILHVIPSLGPATGGPSAAVPAMAAALAAEGLEVHLATTDGDGAARMTVPLNTPLQREGVVYHYFPRQTRFYTTSWPLTTWLRAHVGEVDLLHLHALFSYAALPAAYFAARSGVPYIVRPLGTLGLWGMQNRRPRLKRLSFNLIERRIVNGAFAVQYTSEQERDDARALGITARTEVIPLGLDLRPYRSLPATERFLERWPELRGRRVVLALSRIDPKKGFDVLLPAVRLLRDTAPDVVLVVAGAGDTGFTESLRRQAIDLNLAGNVVWTGHLDGEEKLAALATASVFVLPSYSENFGVAALEAMAAGLPVVLSEHVGLAPTAQEAGAGIAVPLRVDALASALRRILDRPDEARVMGKRAAALAQERYSMVRSARLLHKLYLEAARPGRPLQATALSDRQQPAAGKRT